MLLNKYLLILLLLCMPLWGRAQERIPVQGRVSDGRLPLEGVHIKNVSANKFSVSGPQGDFALNIKKGDTLVFTHVGMQDLIVYFNEGILSEGALEMKMTEKETSLDEVVLEEEKDYALELGIIQERKEKLSTYERRFQAESAMDLNMGLNFMSLPLVPILNAINGRTKELKRNLEVEQKAVDISKLRNQYLDFMLETFECKPSEIEQFLDYVVEQESLEQIMEQGNSNRTQFYLIEQWYKYKE